MKVPQTNRHQLVRLAIFYGATLAAIVTSLYVFSLYFTFNSTGSEPIGFYVYVDGPIRRGDLVNFPSSEQPIREPWVPAYLLKNVQGLPGDDVTVDDLGVSINGQPFGPRPRNNLVKPYFFNGKIPWGEAFVLAPNPRSFDSRHFGPIRSASFRKVVPVWTF